MQLFADLTLARRLERVEAESNAQFVAARSRVHPAVGAEWIEVAGAYCMFDGPDSPCTQTFGLGMDGAPTVAELARIEAFFEQRGAPTNHETCPMAAPGLARELAGRGYLPIEFSSVLYREIGSTAGGIDAADSAITIRLTQPDEARVWAETSTLGWSEFTEYAPLMRGLAEVSARRDDALNFLAERNGEPIGTAALSLCGGVALLAGASTVPAARRQGAQLALLAARLRFAADQGCDVAMMVASPGSGSQRNAERHGFRIAYTRTKWSKPLAQRQGARPPG